jgi:predicted regulator of Ras-like GTPase activity (Roadblock/LC7/MglB family)
MDPAEALTDLKQISTQVERAVVVRNDGTLEASTLRDAAAAESIASAAGDLWSAADAARGSLGRPALSQLEVATPEGSVFCVRDEARMICAVTAGDPTVGLIFYDLKTCLRNIAEEPPEAAVAEQPAVAGGEEPDGEG